MAMQARMAILTATELMRRVLTAALRLIIGVRVPGARISSARPQSARNHCKS
jgi:hypothetical protein